MIAARVALVPVSQTDGSALIRANHASRAHHAPWITPFTDQPSFEQWFATLSTSKIGLVARHVASGDTAGLVIMSQIVLADFQSACLAYYGHVALAGQGLMTEAVRLATRHACEQLGLHRLEANIQPDNRRSIALVRRVGFRKEGVSPRYLRIGGLWRDHERWALLADQDTEPPFA